MGERSAEMFRRSPWTARPAASAERAAHQEGAGIDVDRVLDHRCRIEVLHEEVGDPQRITEVVVTQDVDVERVRSELGPVALHPRAQESEDPASRPIRRSPRAAHTASAADCRIPPGRRVRSYEPGVPAPARTADAPPARRDSTRFVPRRVPHGRSVHSSVPRTAPTGVVPSSDSTCARRCPDPRPASSAAARSATRVPGASIRAVQYADRPLACGR